jgi:hypothetical protein
LGTGRARLLSFCSENRPSNPLDCLEISTELQPH